MATRPTVIARYEGEVSRVFTQNSVEIRAEYTFGTERAALSRLEHAYENVKAQIQSTMQEEPETASDPDVI